MLQYALFIALVIGAAYYGISELGQSVRGGFDAVNTAITVVENINHNERR